MLETTRQIIKSGLKGDPTVSPAERARILSIVRSGTKLEGTESEPANRSNIQRIVRRREAATMYGCSLRLIDRLAEQGVLRRVRLPGRQRGAGFLQSDLLALMGEKAKS